MSRPEICFTAALFLLSALLVAGCEKKTADPAAEAPPAATVEHEGEPGAIHVDQPGRFPLVTATAREATSELNVTGAVTPDVSREIPVVSIASGEW